MERGARAGVQYAGRARVYQEQVASQVTMQAQAVPLPERNIYKIAAPTGKIWRKQLYLHVRMHLSTLWFLLGGYVCKRGVAHPPTGVLASSKTVTPLAAYPKDALVLAPLHRGN